MPDPVTRNSTENLYMEPSSSKVRFSPDTNGRIAYENPAYRPSHTVSLSPAALPDTDLQITPREEHNTNQSQEAETNGDDVRYEEVPRGSPWWKVYAIVFLFLLALGAVSWSKCDEIHHYLIIATAVLCFFLASSGFKHQGDYLDRKKNAVYILLSYVLHALTLVSAGLNCNVTIPRLWLKVVEFPNVSEIQPILDLYRNSDVADLGWTCLGLDIASLLLSCVCLFAPTAAMCVILECCLQTTETSGKFEPYLYPRCCNPFVLVFVGNITVLSGLISSAIPVNTTEAIYYPPVWAGYLSILAAASSMLACLYRNKKKLLLVCMVVQLLGLLAVAGAGVLIGLGLYKICQIIFFHDHQVVLKDRNTDLETLEAVSNWEHLYEAALVSYCLAAICICGGVLFNIGQVARTTSCLLCRKKKSSD